MTRTTVTATTATLERARPATTVYLTGVNTEDTLAAGRSDLGLMVGPGGGTYAKIPAYDVYGADNGCFSKGDAFEETDWLRWLDRLPRDRALFAVAPDVVGDAAATIERSLPYLDTIRGLGFPAAFVAQDGLEDLEVPWERFDVLFVGGSTEWKVGPYALGLATEAAARGKWSHLGRVNSWKRLALANDAGFDSADGTFLAFGPRTNWPRLEGWLDRLRSAGRPTAQAA